MSDVKYWLFRVTDKWGNQTNECLENGFVCCGWNIGLSYKTSEEILKKHSWASRMAIKFTYINPGDIVVMPLPWAIALGRVKEKKYREDLEWQDTLTVEWLTKWYPRNHLSSKLQGTLKYRGTFLELWRYADELGKLIETKFLGIDETYEKQSREIKKHSIQQIASHINSRNNLFFQDREFEDFIMHLFELQYSGLQGTKNTQKQEAKDGKDLTMGIDFDDFDVNIALNIQVKNHEGDEVLAVLNQISKSSTDDPFTRNVVVTAARVTKEMENAAKAKDKEKEICLVGCHELAEMIYENFAEIEEKYKAKLHLFSSVGTK